MIYKKQGKIDKPFESPKDERTKLKITTVEETVIKEIQIDEKEIWIDWSNSCQKWGTTP